MLNNLIFCLNATVPIFFLILLGMFLRKIQLMDDAFTARLNTLVFRVCLPALLFHDMYRTDYRTNWNTAYVVYCALATLASILICTGVSYLLKDRSIQGEFIQTSYRSSATILGIAVVQNLYHNVGMAPLMVIGAVPIYNVAAVIILEMYRPDRGKLDAILLRKTLHGILTNPIILSILLGLHGLSCAYRFRPSAIPPWTTWVAALPRWESSPWVLPFSGRRPGSLPFPRWSVLLSSCSVCVPCSCH